jgi:hypothetical protein
MACAICGTRRPRRFCPGVRGDICSVCCGTEREVTVSCPLDCEYLLEARKHDKPVPLSAEQIPNLDIKLPESLIDRNELLLVFLASRVAKAELETPNAVDSDAREALEALVRTYRTLESGVLYESVPTNPLAANIFRRVQDEVAEFRQQETKHLGGTRTRDADVLACLVFLQRLELDRNNGRPRGRAFLSALMEFYGEAPSSDLSPPEASPLILP